MKKNVIENKIDREVNIDFNFKDIDEKIDYKAKTGKLSFKWVLPAFTCVLVGLLGIVYYKVIGNEKNDVINSMHEESSIVTENLVVQMLELNFVHEKTHYIFSEICSMNENLSDRLNERKVSEELVGNKVATKNINNVNYDIYECKEDSSLLIKYDEHSYFKANIVSFDADVSIEYMLEKVCGLNESNKNNLIKSVYDKYGNTTISNEDYDNFLLGLLDSSIDNQGHENLAKRIHDESVSQGLTTPSSGYVGMYKKEYSIVIETTTNYAIDLSFGITYLINNPQYIRMYGNWIKIDDKLASILNKYFNE